MALSNIKLQIALQEKQINIALIIETHPTNNNTFDISGYPIYVNNRLDGTVSKGSPILIKQMLLNLPFYNINQII